MSRSVVLLSGGIDSLVVAEREREAGRLAGLVFVDYAHPAQTKEAWKVFAYHGRTGVPLKALHAFGLDLGDMGSEDGARVVPARNAMLLSLAANVAPSMGAGLLLYGATAADRRDYPDCRAPFMRAMTEALGVVVDAPLKTWGKTRVIEEARRLGLTPTDAWSCYLGGAAPCGKCPSCQESARAWASCDCEGFESCRVCR